MAHLCPACEETCYCTGDDWAELPEDDDEHWEGCEHCSEEDDGDAEDYWGFEWQKRKGRR